MTKELPKRQNMLKTELSVRRMKALQAELQTTNLTIQISSHSVSSAKVCVDKYFLHTNNVSKYNSEMKKMSLTKRQYPFVRLPTIPDEKSETVSHFNLKFTSLAHFLFFVFHAVTVHGRRSRRKVSEATQLIDVNIYSSFLLRISHIINFLKRGMWHCLKVRGLPLAM